MDFVEDVFNKVVTLITERINVTKEIISELKAELKSKFDIVDNYEVKIRARITKKITYFINVILKIVNNIYQKEHSNFIDVYKSPLSNYDWTQMKENIKIKSLQRFLIKSAGSYMLFQDIQRLREKLNL